MTTMLHLPYGPGIGPGPFTARKGSSSRASFWPGDAKPRVFFALNDPNDNPTREEGTAWTRPARHFIGHRNAQSHTPGRPAPGISGGGMTNELRKDLAVIVGMGFLCWLLTRGWPW